AIGSVWTVCGGVTGPTIGPNQTYTEAECVAMEAAYLTRMYARMGQCVQGEFHPSVVKAFGHFAYNVGEDKFCRSTAARLLNEGRVKAACEQIPRWRFAGGKDCAIRANRCYGIVKRRQWEYQTCMEGA
ncbi:MAG TPA: lysozyme, partial [Thiobacillus sp.]